MKRLAFFCLCAGICFAGLSGCMATFEQEPTVMTVDPVPADYYFYGSDGITVYHYVGGVETVWIGPRPSVMIYDYRWHSEHRHFDHFDGGHHGGGHTG